MANKTWFDSLPQDLQQLVMDVGQEIGNLSTSTILDAGEATLTKFRERGGIVTVLSGDEKIKFDQLMKEKVMPAMADMIDSESLQAAQSYAGN